MTKREAKRLAYRIAYRFVQSSIDVGGAEITECGGTEEDQMKVEAALDQIAQRLFELGVEEKERT